MIGAVLFVFLFFARLSQGGFVAIPLALQSLLAAILLVFRRPARDTAHLAWQILAWASAFLPMMLDVPTRAAWSWFGLPGLVLSLWAMASLGTAFDIVPANRGLVYTGPYRLIRHPMYLGEMLALLPVCLYAPSWRNTSVIVLFSLSVAARICKEDRLLAGGCR